MLHDETLYPDPHTFNPDRYDAVEGAKEQPDPRQWVFGFGRRICPGLHIAEATIFIQLATTLATMQIGRAVDERGEEIVPEVGFTTAIVRYVYCLEFNQSGAKSFDLDLDFWCTSFRSSISHVASQLHQTLPVRLTSPVCSCDSSHPGRGWYHTLSMKVFRLAYNLYIIRALE